MKNEKEKHHEDVCFRCGMTDHWSHTCRMPKHFVELYQASIKKKEKNVETNFIENDPKMNAI